MTGRACPARPRARCFGPEQTTGRFAGDSLWRCEPCRVLVRQLMAPPRCASPRPRATTARCGRSPRCSPIRWPPRTRPCSRCPTSAPRSGTGPTPPGSSRRSSSAASRRDYEPFDPAYRMPVQLATTRGSGRASPARRAGPALPARRRRGRRTTGAHVDDGRCSTCSTDAADDRRARRARRARPAPRAAAPGAAADGHQARALAATRCAPRTGAARRAAGAGDARAGAGSTSTGGLVEIGHDGDGFALRQRGPRHRVLVEPFRLADRLVTCGEWLEFIDDGGYHRPELWLSDGWATVQRDGWEAPLYWERDGDGWAVLHARRHAAGRCRRAGRATSASTRPTPSPAGPAPGCPPRRSGSCGGDAPSAAAATDRPRRRCTRPRPPITPAGACAALRRVWEWTATAYLPYPRFRPPPARSVSTTASSCAGQMVLRGGAASPRPATPGRRTATSSRRRPVGPSPACASPATADGRRRRTSVAGQWDGWPGRTSGPTCEPRRERPGGQGRRELA